METYTKDADGNFVIVPDPIQPPTEVVSLEDLARELNMAKECLAYHTADLQAKVDVAQARYDAAVALNAQIPK